MATVFGILFPLYFIMGMGYLAARRNIFTPEAQKILSEFSFYCAIPFYLFMSMAKVPLETLMNMRFLYAFALSMLAVALIGGFFVRLVGHRDFASCVLAMVSSCYTNSVYIGIPIVMMAFGNPVPSIIVTLFQVAVVTTAMLTAIEIYQKHGLFSAKALREFPKIVLLNPIVCASLMGILFAVEQWNVPLPMERLCELLGGAGIPAALFALGLSLGEKRKPLPAKIRNLVFTLVGLKMFVHPALAWLIGRYVFGLSGLWLGTATLVAAMPTAANIYVFAQRYDAFKNEVGQIVFLSSVISLFTLSAFLMWFGVGR